MALTTGATPPDDDLTDAQFAQRAEAALAAIEAAVDRWLDDDTIDIDVHRTGGLLELALPGGSRIVVNTQPPLRELWLASRRSGQHFRWRAGRWTDARDGSEFFDMLSRRASEQCGVALRFEPPGG